VFICSCGRFGFVSWLAVPLIGNKHLSKLIEENMNDYLLGLVEERITRLNYEINDLAAKQRDLMAERDKAIKSKSEIGDFSTTFSPRIEKSEPAKRGRKPVAPAPVPETAEKPKRGPKAKANNDASNVPDDFNITKNIEAWLAKHKGGVKPKAIVIGIEQVHGVTLTTRQVSFTLQALKKRKIVDNFDDLWHYSGAPVTTDLSDADDDHENDQSYGLSHNSDVAEDSFAA